MSNVIGSEKGAEKEHSHNLSGSVSIAASMGFFSLIIGWNNDVVLSFYMCACNKASFK